MWFAWNSGSAWLSDIVCLDESGWRARRSSSSATCCWADRFGFIICFFPSAEAIAGGGWLTAARGSRLFFGRFFSLLNFFHAANHERRNIALHNLFFARFLAAKCLPSNLGLPLLRVLFILGLIPEIGLSSEKAKVGKNTAIKTSKLTRLKLLLLFLSLWPQG